MKIRVIGGPVLLKIPREVVLRIAELGSPHDPDLLGAHSFAQGLQDTQFVGQAVDSRLACAILFRDNVFPGGRNHSLNGRVDLEGIPGQPAAHIVAHHRERLDHRLIGRVVGVEVEHL